MEFIYIHIFGIKEKKDSVKDNMTFNFQINVVIFLNNKLCIEHDSSNDLF